MPPERQDGAADRYLITGGTGFVGRRVLAALTRRGDQCRSLVRREGGGPDTIRADLADKTALTAACYGIESIFHCAGYAHAFSSLSGDDAAMHWRVNFEGTRNLVEAAGQAGVKRFVFLSSVKAMAESGDVCADEDFPGDPGSAYGHAKRAAENAVLDAGQRYGVHVVNLRLAMVYGAGGRGNLERMGRLVGRGVFPPLPETGNHRSLVHVDDVVSAICLVAKDDRAAGRTYIVASPEAPSGRALFDALRTVQGLPLCTWSVPELVLRSVAKLGDGLESFLKRRLPLDSEALERLLGSAWYSPARIERELGWRAKVSLADGLTEMLRVGL
ncbi:MAG: NAD-dependent epimerase/dehydratase family protein [Azonexus sp.]|nr:NAD-dependent epimerase/dehydratase family protein [Azonexus sp.]